MNEASQLYCDVVQKRLMEPARVWFLAKYRDLTPTNFASAYAGAGRRLGDSPVKLSREEVANLEALGLEKPENWPLRDLGRAALLLRGCGLVDRGEQPAFVKKLFQKGDNAEREALLKTLSMLPDAERFLETATDACRSHVQGVFEAIACENPYPARFFPDLNFNQLVLKAFFTEVRVKRIVGLSQRLSPELTRMANDYASERRAAGRSVPKDLDQVTLGRN